jgi:hypothetical protein
MALSGVARRLLGLDIVVIIFSLPASADTVTNLAYPSDGHTWTGISNSTLPSGRKRLGQTAQTQLSRVRFSSKATALTPAPYIPFPPDRFIPIAVTSGQGRGRAGHRSKCANFRRQGVGAIYVRS